MKRWKNLLFLAGLTGLLTGCAAETPEFKALREQVRLQQKQIVDIKARQEEQQTKLEILDNGFRILGDKAEENSVRLDNSRGRESMSDAPPAISAPALQQSKAVSIPNPPPTPSMPPPATAPAVIQPRLSAADLYRSALDNFTRENYHRAVLEFEEFVANHPDHDLADNAQYWIGECFYAQRKFDEAVLEFAKVETHFSDGNKAPAALLKKGLALKEGGRNEEAIVALEKVISLYPASEESAAAEKRLSQWR